MTEPLPVEASGEVAAGSITSMDGSTVLLAAGYVAAVPTTAMLLRIAWRRNVVLFGVLEAGTAAIVAGWALKDRSFPAYLNAGFGVGFLATWVAVGRVRRRRRAGMIRGQH